VAIVAQSASPAVRNFAVPSTAAQENVVMLRRYRPA
jgi:hypothetical protein